MNVTTTKFILLCGLCLCATGFFSQTAAAANSSHQARASHVQKTTKAIKIDINTADAKALSKIKGIGSKKAEAIVAYRKAHGPFAKVADLAQVKGINTKIIERDQDVLRVSR